MHIYLKLMKEQLASDLFLTTGAPPWLKIKGILHPVNTTKLAVGEVKEIASRIMTTQQRVQFENTMECNFSWSCKDLGRYRINVYQQRGEVALVMRMINSQVPDFASLGIPARVAEIVMRKCGLILVSGAADSGKSTTLAAMVKYRAANAVGHILTIEDPIEFLFQHNKSIVDQREIGIDTLCFSDALHNALREVPDVIMLGEIRDGETARHAINFAQTGHLCIAALYADSATLAIERLINFFPEPAQKQVLQDLSTNLCAVIAQKLIPAIEQNRVLAIEMLVQSALVSELIQRGRLSAIKELMVKAEEEGFRSFDQSLFILYQYGKITAEEAIRHATSGTDMSLQIRLFVTDNETDNKTDGTDGHGCTHPVNVDVKASHVIADGASNGGIP